jgi:predicted DNA-binding protein (MmcQ/YjbR family)
MNFETIQAYLLSKKGTTEERPFGPDALVYKVMGKMFALIAEGSDPLRISLKCDPDEALALRDMYSAVAPGYHLNKRHWNTVIVNGTIPDDEFWRMIDQAYDLVVQGLTRKARAELESL